MDILRQSISPAYLASPHHPLRLRFPIWKPTTDGQVQRSIDWVAATNPMPDLTKIGDLLTWGLDQPFFPLLEQTDLVTLRDNLKVAAQNQPEVLAIKAATGLQVGFEGSPFYREFLIPAVGSGNLEIFTKVISKLYREFTHEQFDNFIKKIPVYVSSFHQLLPTSEIVNYLLKFADTQRGDFFRSHEQLTTRYQLMGCLASNDPAMIKAVIGNPFFVRLEGPKLLFEFITESKFMNYDNAEVLEVVMSNPVTSNFSGKIGDRRGPLVSSEFLAMMLIAQAIRSVRMLLTSVPLKRVQSGDGLSMLEQAVAAGVQAPPALTSPYEMIPYLLQWVTRADLISYFTPQDFSPAAQQFRRAVFHYAQFTDDELIKVLELQAENYKTDGTHHADVLDSIMPIITASSTWPGLQSRLRVLDSEGNLFVGERNPALARWL